MTILPQDMGGADDNSDPGTRDLPGDPFGADLRRSVPRRSGRRPSGTLEGALFAGRGGGAGPDHLGLDHLSPRPAAPQLYDPPTWGRHAALGLVWIAFILLAGSNGPVGRIKATVRHPMLFGVILWSTGHLLANGDQASALLFGAFLAWAVVDLISALGRREPAPVVTRPIADLIMVVAGTALYALFVLLLHRLLFGVSPLG